MDLSDPADLRTARLTLLRPSSNTRPAVWLRDENGRRTVIKDYRANGCLFRNSVGRFLVWREKKAYRRLRGLAGIPQLVETVSGLALVVGAVAAQNVAEYEKRGQLPPGFFDSLGALVDRVHRCGLAHCDLKRASNVLIGEDLQPYIVDWAAAISCHEFRFFPLNRIYRRFLADDFNALIKLRLRHCPDGVSPTEKERFAYRSRAEKFVRWLRDSARSLLQRIA